MTLVTSKKMGNGLGFNVIFLKVVINSFNSILIYIYIHIYKAYVHIRHIYTHTYIHI